MAGKIGGQLLVNVAPVIFHPMGRRIVAVPLAGKH
jgi:hypothetical protein